MSSNNIYNHTCNDRTPYTYLIGWSYLGLFYYGRRTAKGCHPEEFWKSYFTSSSHVAEMRLQGEPDIVEVRYVFDSVDLCKHCENRTLSYLTAARNERLLNRTNGDVRFDTTFKSFTPEINKKKGRPGRRKTEEHKQKIRDSNTGIKKPRSAEYAARRLVWLKSLSAEERKLKFSSVYTEEKKDILSKKSSKGIYRFTSPDGLDHEHHSIVKFAKEHSLNADILYKKVNRGKIEHSVFGSPSEERRRTNGWEVIKLD